MEIRKTSSGIFTEKLEAVKKKIEDAGFWIKEGEWRNLKIQRKKGFFQNQWVFRFKDVENKLVLDNHYPNKEDKEFCRELEKNQKLKL